MEDWNVGIMGEPEPLFHYSIIPFFLPLTYRCHR
jgi:hypothetical protein